MYTENRDTEVTLLKKLWCKEPVICPKCKKATLEHLHMKAKKEHRIQYNKGLFERKINILASRINQSQS